MQNIIRFQEEISRINTEKGFWKDGEKRNRGEAVALIVSELSEAVESHRKRKIWMNYEPETRELLTEDSVLMINFPGHIKDTVEDELADTVIRILDCCKGFGWPIIEREYRKESTGNFAHDVLRLQNYCIKAFDNEEHTKEFGGIACPYPGKDWGYVLAAILKFCEWYNINLEQHVEWKIRFNAGRPHKHGKQY
jgi:hypothetical protein